MISFLFLYLFFFQNLKVAVPESISADLGKYFMFHLIPIPSLETFVHAHYTPP